MTRPGPIFRFMRARSSRMCHTSYPVPVRRPRSFALGFLQTPPRGDALALSLAVGSAQPGRRTSTSLASCHARHTRLSSAAAVGGRLQRLVTCRLQLNPIKNLVSSTKKCRKNKIYNHSYSDSNLRIVTAHSTCNRASNKKYRQDRYTYY